MHVSYQRILLLRVIRAREEKPSLDSHPVVRPVNVARFAPCRLYRLVVVRNLLPLPQRASPDLRGCAERTPNYRRGLAILRERKPLAIRRRERLKVLESGLHVT